ncbi:MAG TPA: PilZ domain-containing protein [Acidimicrobiales bacterium]|nr:PilZ domain-containing protein [Acidimicrobiales bacterium]
MTSYAVPSVGAAVLVTLAEPYGSVDAPVPYRVSDVRDRQLTLHGDLQSGEPRPPAGVPCLVGSLEGTRGDTCEALVVGSGASMLIVDVARDPRQHPRYRRPSKVKLEVPGFQLGVVEGILEDISTGGIRVRTPVSLPLDQRAFVSILLADAHPILAIGEVRGVQRDDHGQGFVVRLQFTVMAPTHQARLALLLEWPIEEPLSL